MKEFKKKQWIKPVNEQNTTKPKLQSKKKSKSKLQVKISNQKTDQDDGEGGDGGSGDDGDNKPEYREFNTRATMQEKIEIRNKIQYENHFFLFPFIFYV